MTVAPITPDRPSRRSIALVLFGALLGLCVVIARPAPAGAEGGGPLVAEPVLSATAAGVKQLFGPSPLEAPGEVWGVGAGTAEHIHIVRYTDAGGWETVPDPVDAAGSTVPLRSGAIPPIASAGRTTLAGGVATLAALSTEGERPPQDLIVRDPGGPLRAVPPPAEPLLKETEQLFRNDNSPKVLVAAEDEPDAKTGAFVVPYVGSKINTAVLHYNGAEWTREPICLNSECKETEKAGFSVLAIEAAGPGQEWMLAKRATPNEPAGPVMLFRREGGQWRQQTLGGELGAFIAKELSAPGGVSVRTTARQAGQSLTVTSQGVWVDATICAGGAGVSAISCEGGEKYDATFYYEISSGKIAASWCDVPGAAAAICTRPLGSELSAGEGRSFAWPGSGAPGDFGTRAVTGIGQGAMLILENGAFARIPLSGNGGGSAGAALSAPDQGWLGPSYRLTREPVPSGLQPWPVPFRRPLLAIAPQPGAPAGALSSQALAVGAVGQVARYLPEVGWQPESLLTGSGSRATPNLRGVAWPTPNFAYAVGDEGAMWLWRASTGLWESDPGAPPNLIRGNFTGIAFDPEEPEWGYAVGKQGLLLRYGKRWTQDKLPAGLNPEANITSIAFAGNEALATWTLAVPPEGEGREPKYIGGLIVNNGSGWRVDEGAATALSEVEHESGLGVAPRRVAGLPDGGAVIVGIEGGVIEREAAGAPWHPVPGPLLGYPAAVAAIREGGQLRAILSIGDLPGESQADRRTDRAQGIGQPPAGQAPLLTAPYPMPMSGVLVRQTATGWRDEERQAYPRPPVATNQKGVQPSYDLPREPDPVLAILVSADGSQGWVIGGQTGEAATKESGSWMGEGVQTAAALRYGSTATPPGNASGAPISAPAGEATFAIGGGAQCEASCADLVNTGIGPDVWLRTAVARAASISGLRAFLYTGSSVSGNLDLSKVPPRAFAEEEAAYARRLGSEAGALPVFAAPSESDRYDSSLATFASQFGGFPAPLGASPAVGITPVDPGERSSGNYSYSFDSADASGANVVRVIVFDDSVTPVGQQDLCWLGGQLSRARAEGRPAIVVGNREVGAEEELRQMLVTGTSAACPQAEPGAASAYFFKIEGNTVATLSWGSASIPAFGTGSLGYLGVPDTRRQELVPASGFLLASVNVAARSEATNVAPVSVRLIPNIGSLAINARDGTLLRRSQTALFEALARRPIAGISCKAASDGCIPSPDPYIQIPARCVAGHGYRGGACAAEIAPEYRFSSSRPDIANFVKVDPTSTNARAVFLNGSGEPVADPSSGLLCAFNSGTTIVSIETGGLSYSVPVTVQKGSVQRPCGTVPRTDLVAPPPPITPPPPPPPAGQPPFKSPPSTLPPPQAPAPTPVPTPTPTPAPQPVVKVPAKAPAPPAPAPFFSPTPSLTPLVVIVPPPPAPSVQPTPPSGTSPVTQPATSPQPEEEEEAAFDLVHHMVALRSPEPRPVHWAPSASAQARGGESRLLIYGLPALMFVAALAGAGGAKRRRPPQLAFEHHAPGRSRSQ